MLKYKKRSSGQKDRSILRFKNKHSGAMTLEAAIVMPMFIILMLALNGLFVHYMGQQIVTHALVQSAKSLAMDPYATQRVKSNEQDKIADLLQDVFSIGERDYISTEEWYKNPADVEKECKKRFTAFVREDKNNADELLELVGVKNGIEGLDFSGSSVDNDGYLTIKIKYTQEFVYNAADMASFDKEVSVKVKLFEYKN